MEPAALELAEMFEENCHECCDVLGAFLGCTLRDDRSNECTKDRDRARCTYHSLAVFCIRETYANGLVNEEYIGVLVPRVRVECRVVW